MSKREFGILILLWREESEENSDTENTDNKTFMLNIMEMNSWGLPKIYLSYKKN